jgi:hypothetical protein
MHSRLKPACRLRNTWPRDTAGRCRTTLRRQTPQVSAPDITNLGSLERIVYLEDLRAPWTDAAAARPVVQTSQPAGTRADADRPCDPRSRPLRRRKDLEGVRAGRVDRQSPLPRDQVFEVLVQNGLPGQEIVQRHAEDSGDDGGLEVEGRAQA